MRAFGECSVRRPNNVQRLQSTVAYRIVHNRSAFTSFKPSWARRASADHNTTTGTTHDSDKTCELRDTNDPGPINQRLARLDSLEPSGSLNKRRITNNSRYRLESQPNCLNLVESYPQDLSTQLLTSGGFIVFIE
jgi:hypothetical protein